MKPPLKMIAAKFRPAPTMISQKPGWRRLTMSDMNTSVVESTYSDGPRLPTLAASGELNSRAWKKRPARATGHSRMCTDASAPMRPRVATPTRIPIATA